MPVFSVSDQWQQGAEDVPKLSVVVPWHNTHPTRAQSWRWLKRWYEKNMPFAELVEVQPDEGDDFHKPTLVNAGVEKAHGAVVIVADSDVIPMHPEVLRTAARHALYAPWVVPHGQVLRLRQEPTTKLLGEPPTASRFPTAPLVRHPYTGIPGGGMFIIRRDRFLSIGGFDPEFTGWGGEDTAFGVAADTLLGQHVRYVHVPLVHFFHPPGPRSLHQDYAKNVARVNLYRSLAEQGREALAQELGVPVPEPIEWKMERPQRADTVYEWLLYLGYLGAKTSRHVAVNKLALIHAALNAEQSASAQHAIAARK